MNSLSQQTLECHLQDEKRSGSLSTGTSPSASSIFHKPELDIEQNSPSRDTCTTANVADEADEPPPDGGWHAWTQALMAHLVIVNTWGTINSFGIFQTFYRDFLSRPASDISWIGSMQVFFLFVVGVFTGRLTDAGYFRAVFATGSALVVVGSLAASLATEYWQLFLAQGLCVGLGMGGLFCPVMAVLSTYFKRRRNLAIGIAISGSATGGMVYPVMARQLLPEIGFGWTMRAMALVQFVTLVVANVFMKARLRPRRSGPLIELSAFKEKPYSLFTVGMFFATPRHIRTPKCQSLTLFSIGPFSRDVLSFSSDSSIDILMIMNGVGAVGRVLPGFLADQYLGPLNVVTPAAAICTVLLYCWTAIESAPALYGWAVLYGIFGATVQGLFPAALSSLTADLRKAGTRMGMVYSIISFANLTGPPIAGSLIKAGGGSYTYAFMFGGTCLFLGVSFLVACRIAKGGFGLAKV
ncbi:putative transporter MCH4-like protein 7 [Colletotrichum chlorophyti]|uniref:Putative transporter MCH4-like protein 7 n=1 Tax=Colletotrichum chlorophyti TaxID=708187 RepID=A0A1Q8RPN9_9PEZI|nr:putative transporter MCH4-like protein 7 [Colletotrichum chlorophyti]